MPPAPKKILVVDDDKMLLEMSEAIFKSAGFDVHAATDGKEAWDLLRGGYVAPDLIFTGILMPRMTGFELLQILQTDPKFSSIPVVIFSHRNRDEDRRTAEALGVTDFIPQGLTAPAEIVRRVEKALGRENVYRIYLKRFHDDAERLVELLDLQQHTSVGLTKNETCFLELTPMKERGEFKVKMVTRKSEGEVSQ